MLPATFFVRLFYKLHLQQHVMMNLMEKKPKKVVDEREIAVNIRSVSTVLGRRR